jgi:hypothetical protein
LCWNSRTSSDIEKPATIGDNATGLNHHQSPWATIQYAVNQASDSDPDATLPDMSFTGSNSPWSPNIGYGSTAMMENDGLKTTSSSQRPLLGLRLQA